MCLNFNVVYILKDLMFRILIVTSMWNKTFKSVLLKHVKHLTLIVSHILL